MENVILGLQFIVCVLLESVYFKIYDANLVAILKTDRLMIILKLEINFIVHSKEDCNVDFKMLKTNL